MIRKRLCLHSIEDYWGLTATLLLLKTHGGTAKTNHSILEHRLDLHHPSLYKSRSVSINQKKLLPDPILYDCRTQAIHDLGRGKRDGY